MMIDTKPEPSTGAAKRQPWWKQFLAFSLGLLSLFFGFYLNETFGRQAALIGMGAYFLIAQYLLSRGHSCAFVEDGALIAAMNCPLLCLLLVGGGIEMFLLVIVTLVSSFAGTMLASITAGRAAHREP
jgi:hypothetical protein